MMNRHVEAYLRYALQYPCTTDKIKRKIVKFFHHLLLNRSSQFIRETKCKDSGIEKKTMDQVRKEFLVKLPDMVRSIEREMLENYYNKISQVGAHEPN
jgi:hypothetical protein